MARTLGPIDLHAASTFTAESGHCLTLSRIDSLASISTILTVPHQGPIVTMGGVERPGGTLCNRGSSAADGVQAQLDWEA